MKNKSEKAVYIFCIALAVILIGIFTWFAAFQDSPQTENLVVNNELGTLNPQAYLTYSNSTYDFSFEYPSDWVLDSSSIDGISSAARGLDNGSSHLQLTKTNEDTGRLQKIELTLVASSDTPESFEATKKEKRVITANGNTWYFGKEGSDGSENIQFTTLIPFTFQNNKYIQVYITGFSFVAEEKSEYSESLENVITEIVSSIKFK